MAVNFNASTAPLRAFSVLSALSAKAKTPAQQIEAALKNFKLETIGSKGTVTTSRKEMLAITRTADSMTNAILKSVKNGTLDRGMASDQINQIRGAKQAELQAELRDATSLLRSQHGKAVASLKSLGANATQLKRLETQFQMAEASLQVAFQKQTLQLDKVAEKALVKLNKI